MEFDSLAGQTFPVELVLNGKREWHFANPPQGCGRVVDLKDFLIYIDLATGRPVAQLRTRNLVEELNLWPT